MSLLAFPLAITLGRLGAKHPHAGGIVEYARLAFGDLGSRITAWLFLGTIPIGVPIIALVGANYVAGTFGLPHWTIPVMAAVMLFASLGLHRQGVDIASWVQVLILSLIAIIMAAAIITAGPHMHSADFHPFVAHGLEPGSCWCVAVTSRKTARTLSDSHWGARCVGSGLCRRSHNLHNVSR